MYIATVPNRNSPPAFLLRESFRQGGKVKNRTLANLSHWPAARLEALRRLLGQGALQMSLFTETVTEVEAEGVRYLLRRNPQEAAREQHRLEDKLAKLQAQIQARNQQVREHPRCEPAAGQRRMQAWVEWHELTGLVDIKLEGNELKLERDEEAIAPSLELAGCYVVTTDVASVAMSAEQVHDSYMALEKVERDFRTLKTRLLEVRPVWVRKESRTRGHDFCCLLALKLSREMERRLRGAFGTTETRADAVTLPDALRSLARLCLLHYRKTTVTKLPQPDARQQEILKAVGVTFPAL
jgi:transposase